MPTRRIVAFLVGSTVLMTLVGISANAERPTLAEVGGSDAPRATAVDENEFEVPGEQAIPRPSTFEIPAPVLLVVAALAAFGFLYFLTRQQFTVVVNRRRALDKRPVPVMTEQEQADQLAALAADLIVELSSGDDPRHAIQAAYAAVEGGFGRRELERKPAETPLKYLDRIFGRHRAAAPALGRLTELFQIARFSDAPVDETMRQRAIDALADIRKYYERFAGRAVR